MAGDGQGAEFDPIEGAKRAAEALAAGIRNRVRNRVIAAAFVVWVLYSEGRK